MDVSADGTSLFVVREERLARFDTATGKATHPVVPTGCYVDVLSASFDGSRVLAFCSDRVTLFSYGAGRDAPIPRPIGVGRVTYEKVALAPHGDLIVTGHDDGTLRVWDTAGAMRAELRPVAGADAMLVRSAAGRVLLAGKDASTIEDHLSCRVGPRALPFVVCADALGDDDVLADALAPGSP
jgi:WD40 repeat protein